MKSKREVRVLNLDLTQLQVEKRDDGPPKISGYAAVFNKKSEDLGFIETIKPGAFKKSLKKSDVRALFNHDPNFIIGRSGVNLHLKEDRHGLHMTVDPIMTETYRMVAENIQAGLVTQQSFAFTVEEDEWDEDFKNRTIHKVREVFDVSPVTYPAYPDTSVALRKMQNYNHEPTVAEQVVDELIKRGLVSPGPSIRQTQDRSGSKDPIGDDELWNKFESLKEN